jgi:glutaredoxin-related protein
MKMTVKLFALSYDPDTATALSLLRNANIDVEFVDVEREGILACLDRDLDIKELPFIILQNRKIEGLQAIEGFARHAA